MNAAKRKGTAHEVRVRDYLARRGLSTIRPALSGSKDVGDLVGVPGWVIECKDTAFGDMAGAMDEAQREALNADVPHAVVVMHRRRANVARAYAIVDLETWATLVGAPVKEYT